MVKLLFLYIGFISELGNRDYNAYVLIYDES